MNIKAADAPWIVVIAATGFSFLSPPPPLSAEKKRSSTTHGRTLPASLYLFISHPTLKDFPLFFLHFISIFV